jgi:hypothetical protein
MEAEGVVDEGLTLSREPRLDLDVEQPGHRLAEIREVKGAEQVVVFDQEEVDGRTVGVEECRLDAHRSVAELVDAADQRMPSELRLDLLDVDHEASSGVSRCPR